MVTRQSKELPAVNGESSAHSTEQMPDWIKAWEGISQKVERPIVYFGGWWYFFANLSATRDERQNRMVSEVSLAQIPQTLSPDDVTNFRAIGSNSAIFDLESGGTRALTVIQISKRIYEACPRFFGEK